MIEFGILGPLTFRRDGQSQHVPTVMSRRLLSLLLARAGQPLKIDLLVEAMWSGQPPRTARQSLQVHMSRLRRVLADHKRVVTHHDSYSIHVLPDELDSGVFERLVAESAAAKDPEAARKTLRQALGLWRGPAYDGMLDMPPVAAEADRLEHLRLAATEEVAQLDLDAGAHTAVIAELVTVIAQHPYRERMRGLYMLALYRSGRQREAMEAYRQTYHLLARELGIEPTPELQELHRRMLSGDSTLTTRQQRADLGAYPRTRPNLLPRSMAQFTGRSDQLAALDALSIGALSVGAPSIGAPSIRPLPSGSLSNASPPIGGLAVRDGAVRDGAVRDGAVRDGAVRDGAVRDGASSPVAILSAITGSAGVGKTALAVHWARRASDRFPDGQLYINLQGYGGGEPLRPLDALTHLLRELGVPVNELPDDEQSAVARYRSVLANRKALVILDNANSVGQVRPLLATGSACMSVVTSRDRLTGLVAIDGATRVNVDVLSVAESVTLLATVLGAERINAEPQAATELANLCGRLPLALRVAAAALVDEPMRTLADHVKLLAAGNRLPLLAIDGDPDSSVRTALSYSYLRLADAIKRMFRLLSLAPAVDIGVGAAAALAGTSTDEAASLLNHLCEAHLLAEPTLGRFQLHDLIRDYARELATIADEPKDRDAALDRLLTWYAAQAYNASAQLNSGGGFRPPALPNWVDTDVSIDHFADQLAALTWFDQEGPNIIGTVRAIETIRPARCWQLASTLFVWLQRQRRANEWVDIYSIGLNAARAIADAHAEALMETGLGVVASQAGRLAEAPPHFAKALEIRRKTGDPYQIVEALRYLGGGLGSLRRSAEAVVSLTEALEIIDCTPALEDQRAIILNNIGFAYSRSERQEDAIPFYERAVAAAEANGDHVTAASTSNNVAAVLMRLDRFDDAEAPLRRSLAHAEQIGHNLSVGRALTNLGHVALRQRNIDDAQMWVQRAIAADVDIDDSLEALRKIVEAHVAAYATGSPAEIQRVEAWYADIRLNGKLP